jgi:uncharacterized protein
MLRTLTEDKLVHPDDILVHDSPINGRGLFVARPYRADEVLMIIGGEPIDELEALRRERAESNWYIYWNHGTTYIDAALTPKGRYLNHACVPNTVTAPRDDSSLYLVALRDIAPGEELTLDYDYPEIYEVCRSHNSSCLHAACPPVVARIQGDHS